MSTDKTYDDDDFEDFEDADESVEKEKPTETAATVDTAASSAPATTVDEALRRGEWVKHHDATSGKHYYYHAKTSETTWDLEKLLAQRSGKATAAATTAVKPLAVAPTAATPSGSNTPQSGRSGSDIEVPNLVLPHKALAKMNDAGTRQKEEEDQEKKEEQVTKKKEEAGAKEKATTKAPSPQKGGDESSDFSTASEVVNKIEKKQDDGQQEAEAKPQQEKQAQQRLVDTAPLSAGGGSAKPIPSLLPLPTTPATATPTTSSPAQPQVAATSSGFLGLGLSAGKAAQQQQHHHHQQRPALTPTTGMLGGGGTSSVDYKQLASAPSIMATTVTTASTARQPPVEVSAAQPGTFVSAPQRHTQEAAEVLDVLVRAYAHLRSHNMQQQQPQQQQRHSAAAAAAALAHVPREEVQGLVAKSSQRCVRVSTDIHRGAQAGATATTATGKVSHALHQQRTSTDTYLARLEQNEDLLEEDILSMVVEMMLRDSGSGGAATSRSTAAKQHVDPLTQLHSRPYAAAAGAGSGGGNFFASTSFADTADVFQELEAFSDPNAVFELVAANIDKYFLRLVRRRTLKPALARAVLLDLLNAAHRVARSDAFDHGSHAGRGSQQSLVAVRYDGPPMDLRLLELCTRLVHCLPFESIENTEVTADGSDRFASDTKPRLFRLEYWVTLDKLYECCDALSGALRGLERLTVDPDVADMCMGTKSNRNTNDRKNANPEDEEEEGRAGRCVTEAGAHHSAYFFEQPLFSFVDLGRKLHPSERERSMPRQQKQRRHAGKDYFGVGDEDVEKLTYTVSKLALDAGRHAVATATAASEEKGNNKENQTTSEAGNNKQQQRPQQGSDELQEAEKMRRIPVELWNEAVCDTVIELLTDVSVCASVVKRSTDKVKKAAKEKSDKKAREEQEEGEVARRGNVFRVATASSPTDKSREHVLEDTQRRVDMMIERMKHEMGIA